MDFLAVTSTDRSQDCATVGAPPLDLWSAAQNATTLAEQPVVELIEYHSWEGTARVAMAGPERSRGEAGR